MLNFGQDLYRLTARDEETLLVEPYFRAVAANIGAGLVSATATFITPLDRCLYLHSVMTLANPGATHTWSIISVLIGSPDGVVSQVLSDRRGLLTGDGNAAAVGGTTVSFRDDLRILLPPGVRVLVFCEKNAATNAAFFTANVHGYLVPPGQIGRQF